MARPQTAPNFSGLWKQDNDRCQPKRSGNVNLRIEQIDPKLKIESTIAWFIEFPVRGAKAHHGRRSLRIDGYRRR